MTNRKTIKYMTAQHTCAIFVTCSAISGLSLHENDMRNYKNSTAMFCRFFYWNCSATSDNWYLSFGERVLPNEHGARIEFKSLLCIWKIGERANELCPKILSRHWTMKHAQIDSWIVRVMQGTQMNIDKMAKLTFDNFIDSTYSVHIRANYACAAMQKYPNSAHLS